MSQVSTDGNGSPILGSWRSRKRRCAAFIARNRQDRWLSGLASKKRRQETMNRLHAGFDFRDDVQQPFKGDAAALESELRRRGALQTCHVMGGDHDGEVLALSDALADAVQGYGGLLLVCVPGRLAVHFPEAPSDPVILTQ